MSETETQVKTFDKIEKEIETENLVKKFFEVDTPEEINEKLSLMLSNYILHAPVDKLDLASSAWIVSRLTNLLYQLNEKVK